MVEEIEVPPGQEPDSIQIIISQLDDPEWRGVWVGPGGVQPAEIHPFMGDVTASPGHWMSIPVPGPGRWSLHLRYEGRAAYFGLAVSAVAWTVWLAAWVHSRRRDRTATAPPPSVPATPNPEPNSS